MDLSFSSDFPDLKFWHRKNSCTEKTIKASQLEMNIQLVEPINEEVERLNKHSA
jgi:hypothetical protein